MINLIFIALYRLWNSDKIAGKKLEKYLTPTFLGRVMQIKLIKDVVSAISGPASSGIVDALYGKKNVNEFLIAKKLNMNINQTRNILYKLSDQGLVSFVRKKDKKNGGWYTYFWTLDIGKSLMNLKNTVFREIKLLEAQVNSKENNRFYYSPTADVEYSEEKALEYNFICPETGEVMELKNTSSEVGLLKKKVEILKKDLETVESELIIVQKKDGVVKARKIKSEERKKAIERAEKRKKSMLERKKNAGKISKVQTSKGSLKKPVKKFIEKKTLKNSLTKAVRKVVQKTKKKSNSKKSVKRKK